MVVVVVPSSGGSVLANSSSVCQFLVTEVRRATTSSVYEPWSMSHTIILQLITCSSYERVFFMSNIVDGYFVCGILWSMISNRIFTKY